MTPAEPDLDPRTGEPRRPWPVWAAAALLYAGVAVATAGLLWTWWLSVTAWPDASPLHGWLTGRMTDLTYGQLAWTRAGVAVGEFAVVVLASAAALVAGYHGWRGQRWSRWAGVIAAVLAAGVLVLDQVAWAALPLVVLGAAALWLPASRRFQGRWHGVRNPEPRYPAWADAVAYGPLPRYRDA